MLIENNQELAEKLINEKLPRRVEKWTRDKKNELNIILKNSITSSEGLFHLIKGKEIIIKSDSEKQTNTFYKINSIPQIYWSGSGTKFVEIYPHKFSVSFEDQEKKIYKVNNPKLEINLDLFELIFRLSNKFLYPFIGIEKIDSLDHFKAQIRRKAAVESVLAEVEEEKFVILRINKKELPIIDIGLEEDI